MPVPSACRGATCGGRLRLVEYNHVLLGGCGAVELHELGREPQITISRPSAAEIT
jgi:hypothetical protein